MVVAAGEHLHVVQEEDSSKRRKILEGARKVFMDLGFDGASMGEIARAAQVSKGTLQKLAALGAVFILDDV